MGIAEGTFLGILTIASLFFVWSAIRVQEKQREEDEGLQLHLDSDSSNIVDDKPPADDTPPNVADE